MTSLSSSPSLNEGDVLVPLTPLDAIMAHLGLTVIYVFPPSQPPYDLDRVRAALISTVDEDYPLFLGSQHVDPATGAVFIRQTAAQREAGAKGLRFFTDADSPLTTEQAVASPPTSFLPERDNGSEVLTLKATLLRDGGLVLGFNSTHALLDGEGIFTFFNVWGMHYRGLPKSERIVINHDRHLVMPRGGGFKIPHPEFIAPTMTQPETPAGVEAKGGDVQQVFPKTTQKPFHLTPQQLKSLKAAVSEGLSEGEYVSTIDVVTALFLVLVTKARGHGRDVKITTGVNGRTRFSPPLPVNFAGNCIFNALSTYNADELAEISVESVRRAALRIRASILRRDEEFMRDAIEFIAQDSGRWIEMRAGLEFFFGADIMFTSWANMGMYNADFGAGKAVYAGPPILPLCDGMVVVMEGMNHATGLDVLPLLECEAMDKLTQLWNACELLQL